MKQETPYQIVVKDRIDYRFSRVYLLRFSKDQLGPRDIDLNNNNTGRRVFISYMYIIIKFTELILVNIGTS